MIFPVDFSWWKAVQDESWEWLVLGVGFFPFLSFFFLGDFLSARDAVCLQDTRYFWDSACSHTFYELNPSKTQQVSTSGSFLMGRFVDLGCGAGLGRGAGV